MGSLKKATVVQKCQQNNRVKPKFSQFLEGFKSSLEANNGRNVMGIKPFSNLIYST